ncbi:uncharacterized protein BKA55DRAFT_541783 [Fusarium redolens]|uniref:Uncharacterized protein n=1 Tax=Fusarium redolens TaxID=48865 RepID=A0A9P9GRM4_FUSRE|nr:uncharacterized protein BKA55DRAFT_541783 [Fusarium redolens]KAH7243527.1 hypothetical protein BKA55DRAFT_541783 [Fusarium redolens]
MGLNWYQGGGVILTILAVIYILGLIRFYCWIPKAQTKDEEQGNIVISREENYEGIFVNPRPEQNPHQPVPSNTPISLRAPHKTLPPAYKTVPTPPPCYTPGLKVFKPDSTKPSSV